LIHSQAVSTVTALMVRSAMDGRVQKMDARKASRQSHSSRTQIRILSYSLAGRLKSCVQK